MEKMKKREKKGKKEGRGVYFYVYPLANHPYTDLL